MKPDLLKGRTAIVTGAGDGIGRGIAVALAEAGADVAVCARREASVKETAGLVESAGKRAYWENFDIRVIENIRSFTERTERELGPISILVNSAAVMPVVEIEEMSEADFDECVDAKFKSAVFFSKYCIPSMKRAGGGSIIHMASVTGNVGFARHGVYGACNAALMGLARGQAMELAPFGIRANTVSPGTVDSPMLSRYIAESGEDPEKLKAAFDAHHPRGKVGSIEEVAAVFAFLASDLSANITAADIRCDGGLSFKGGQANVKD